MGEPIVYVIYRWHSDSIESINPDAVIWLKVSSSDERNYAFIQAAPVTPKVGEWAMDSPGSPDWNQVIVQKFSGRAATAYWQASDARKFWKEGFHVVDAIFTY